MTGSAQLITQILENLATFESIQLRLDPGKLHEYQKLVKATPDFSGSAESLRAVELPEPQAFVQRQLLKAAAQLGKGKEAFLTAGPGQAGLMSVFRSLRFFSRTYEALYPLAAFYTEIHRFFLETATDTLPAIPPKIAAAEIPLGISNLENERGQRGGYSLYVPEYYRGDKNWPLIVALHGGSGHGADFFWNWLPSARSRGAILLSPSSKENTWSMNDPTQDGKALPKIVGSLIERFNIDATRMLLTGISDGGTFALMLTASSMNIFTHCAPVACAGHAFGRHASQFAGKEIYMVHGGKDWMFPVGPVRHAASALKAAGAQIMYREIDDLSHNYPRDENPRILDWMGIEPATKND
jgi:phospholipase/carboxylesterase